MGGYLVTIWLVYGLAAAGLTFLLARTLYRHGTVFLQTVFSGSAELARSVNGLLVAGFCMLSLGYAALLLGPSDLAKVRTGADAVVLLVNRLGLLLVSLGVIHFVNMWLFYRLGSRGGLRSGPAAAGGANRLGTREPKQEALA
ncbi:MAG TPA: hypothetical protein VII47_03820 [Actinomycetota bacterium]|jgi:heme exporter protein D